MTFLEAKTPVVLFIDSLSILIIKFGLAAVCKLLHTIQTKYSSKTRFSLVGVVHMDLHDEQTSKSLDYVVNVVIQLYSPESYDSPFLSFEIFHKRKGGKIIRAVSH
jgi:hypothetical protein